MHVVDLFSGLGGWSQAFVKDHEVTTIDWDPFFNADIIKDVRKLRGPEVQSPVDLVLASPPCNGFSVQRVNRNWFGPEPRSVAARDGVAYVRKTLELIDYWEPKYFIIENPVGMLRKLGLLDHLEWRVTTQCRYGKGSMKPTDLWGRFPPRLTLRTPCANGDWCHPRAPRGSQLGTTGLPRDERAKIPELLSRAVLRSLEPIH
jgi:hypothetical protein